MTPSTIATVRETPIALRDPPLHENDLDCGLRMRDDAQQMRKCRPGLDLRRPRF